jgi:hypothetical protein
MTSLVSTRQRTLKMVDLFSVKGSLNVELTSEEIKYLGEPYVPRAVFGH